MAYLNTIQSHNDDLRDILADVNALPDAGSSDPVLQSKTVTPSTDTQVVEPDDGYDGLALVTVEAMPIATQATPTISVSASGKITATATQSAGYVSSGTKSATKQLTTQAAQTITPGTTNKTISSGRYLTGTQTIKGDANLLPENIVSGKTIFGVAGTAETGGGSGLETCTVEFSQDGSVNYIVSTQVIDGVAVPYYLELTTSDRTWQAPCGSVIVIACDLNLTAELDKMTYVGNADVAYPFVPAGMGYMSGSNLKVYRIDAGAGETARIYLEEEW